jgi:hypothetical protein
MKKELVKAQSFARQITNLRRSLAAADVPDKALQVGAGGCWYRRSHASVRANKLKILAQFFLPPRTPRSFFLPPAPPYGGQFHQT